MTGTTRKRLPSGRSTSTAIPLLTVTQPGGVVFAGLIWSGAWAGQARRDHRWTRGEPSLEDVFILLMNHSKDNFA